MPPLSLFALALSCRNDGRAPPAPDDLPIDLEAAARAVLATHVDSARFGATDVYPVLRLFEDHRGIGHVVFQQTVDGVPVFGGEVGVHLRDDGTIRAIVDELEPDLAVDPKPALDADEALALAGGVDGDAQPELWVVRHDGQDHLAWVVQLSRIEQDPPTQPRIFLDADTGEEFWRYENLRTEAWPTATRYDGTQTIEAYHRNMNPSARDYLEDTGRGFHTFSFNASYGTLYYVSKLHSSASFTDSTLGSIHWGTQSTLDYYLTRHARDGIDGVGGPTYPANSISGSGFLITAAGHYGSNYNNAFWDTVNHIAVFGDGNGATFSPLVSLDVVAHEYTHGVTAASANLVYLDEPGAVNESVSDVFGAAIERHVAGATSTDTWKIGEDCYTPATAGDALRYMDDPTLDGFSRDHYDDRYVGPQDNGGVHWNSGIGNLAFVLASEGGVHPTYGGTPVTGLTFETAADIWYDALTLYALQSTDFHGFRTATILATEDAYGVDSAETRTVDDAWDRVGVTPWVLLPTDYAAGGVGSPSVEYLESIGDRVMAFETLTAPADDLCPNGYWSIGLATASGTDREFSLVGSVPLLGPAAGTYRSCVVAHPTVVVDDAGTGLHLWFKAEQDTGVCGDDGGCLYTGVGYAHVQSDLATVDVVSSAPVVVTSGVMGYPSVARADGIWYMTLQQFPSVHLATALDPAGTWTIEPDPVLDPGVTSWATDEVFNAALSCSDDPVEAALSATFGGRFRAGDPAGPVVDGGVGTATSDDGITWTVEPTTLMAFEGDEKWRHWSVMRNGDEIDVYYDEKVGGVNRIGLRTTLTAWTATGLADRKCP